MKDQIVKIITDYLDKMEVPKEKWDGTVGFFPAEWPLPTCTIADEIAEKLADAIAPHMEAGERISEAQDIVVKVAASLVRQQASEYAEDLDLPKTTPITAIRKFETEAQNWNDRNRLRAIELKRAYDLLK